MFTNNTFGRTVEVLHRTMDVSLLRRSVIADNIANADTPNFKRSTINFESQLKRAFESQKRETIPALMTDSKHMPFYKPVDFRSVGPKRVLDYLTSSKNNGNNVDVEEEMMQSMQNQLNYQLMTLSVSNQFSQVNMVLR